MPEKEIAKEVVNNPDLVTTLLELAVGGLMTLFGVLTWRVIKSVPKVEFDNAVKGLKDDFDSSIKDLKKDLKTQITEYKEDAKADNLELKDDLKAQVTEYKEDSDKGITEVKGICANIFKVMEKRKDD